MPDQPPASRLGPLRSRLRLLETGLFLPVVITAALGVGYLQAIRARQAAIDAGGQLLARRTAERTLAAAGIRGDRAAVSLLDPIHDLRHPTPSRILATIARATDSLRACRCGPLKEGAYAFVAIPATGTFVTSVSTDRATDPRWQYLRAVRPGPRTTREIFAAGGLSAGGPWLIHFVATRIEGREALVGIDVGMTSWWTDTFGPAVAEVRRATFPGDPAVELPFAAALLAGPTEVGRDGPGFSGPSAAFPLFPNLPFTFAVTLNPAVLPAMLAAAGPPGYPVLGGALAASLAASVLALILLRQIRRTMAQREAFLASISHELRTPLTEILLHGESLLLDRPTPVAKSRAATAIVRETRRTIALVENALTVAGAGRRPDPAFQPGPVRLAPVVREALAALGPAAADRRVRIEADLDEISAVAIEPIAVERILTNLVSNALRYGPEGQTIRVRLTGGGLVRLMVDDQGPGVPTAERHRIWDPFERGAAGQRVSGPGVGLGLAIVRHLAGLAGGTVGVEPAPGGGARFAVAWPAARPASVESPVER
ncbi:MAG: HAMP domain-containing histidine kinase [Gemmatimonadetes bacterium]|nr:HAMP domain-containing histidine kinase [Gemmatimonadota bacterium]